MREKNCSELESELLIAVGKRIRARRLHANISQEELAAKANFNKAYISEIECGKRSFSIKVIASIASALRVKASKIFLEAEALIQAGDASSK